MAQLCDMPTGTGTEKRAQSYFGAPAPKPTLDDLLNRVGADFSYNYMQQREIEDRIRDVQEMPGNSGQTLLSSLRGAIGDGLRAVADRYFTPGPRDPFDFSGYKRI